MESDNEQTKITQLNILHQLSQTNKFDYLDNNNDCLTDAFLTIYETSLWCIKVFFKSLCQVLLFTQEELHYTQNDTIDIMSMNNSAGKDFSKEIYRELPRRHLSMRQRNNRLSKSNSQHLRQKTLSKINMLTNKTRVTVRSISNQNLNQTQSNHTLLTKENNSSNTLGTINSHIIVLPVNSSHLKQTENINLREQLTDQLCHRSYEPLTFINRGMCCGHCRPLYFPNIPFHYPGHYSPPNTLQQELNQERELSQKSKQSPQMSDASETQSTSYSVSPNIRSHLTDSPEDELLSIDTKSNNEIHDQNQSVFSFPEHDKSPSQRSEELINDGSQLKLNAQILVDNSIQNAQEKYQQILQMNNDQDLQNSTLASVKQTIKNKLKPAFISNESNVEKLSDDNILCQELCNQLNLSDSNQIPEIIRILASNAPHILKEQPLNKTSSIKNSTTNKDNENTLCSQLLLHPPFKPKRLIHLCPDGSIQVLSAIDENSNENQMINQQQYRLNYSNSAITPSIQQNHILTNESSRALVDVETNFSHMMFTESTSTQQSHSKNEILFDHLIMDNNSILSLQQKKTLFKYDSPLMLEKDVPFNSDHSKAISQDDDLVVKINLDLNDEILEGNSGDDENSLPEIFFKRIIVPENSITPLSDEKTEVLNVHRKKHQKSRHSRSRSYTNKHAINVER